MSYIVYSHKQTIIPSKSYSQNFLRERACSLSVEGERRVLSQKPLYSLHTQNYSSGAWGVTVQVHRYFWGQLPERLLSRNEGNYS